MIIIIIIIIITTAIITVMVAQQPFEVQLIVTLNASSFDLNN